MGEFRRIPEEKFVGEYFRVGSAETMILFIDLIRVGDFQNFLGELGAGES